MHALDWIFSFLPLLIVLVVGIYAQRHVKSVGRFSFGQSFGGALSPRHRRRRVAGGARSSSSRPSSRFPTPGFTLNWWQWLSISGRDSGRHLRFRFLSLPRNARHDARPVFEIRYNKSFRLFTGLLGFLAGLFNFGIIPRRRLALPALLSRIARDRLPFFRAGADLHSPHGGHAAGHAFRRLVPAASSRSWSSIASRASCPRFSTS